MKLPADRAPPARAPAHRAASWRSTSHLTGQAANVSSAPPETSSGGARGERRSPSMRGGGVRGCGARAAAALAAAAAARASARAHARSEPRSALQTTSASSRRRRRRGQLGVEQLGDVVDERRGQRDVALLVGAAVAEHDALGRPRDARVQQVALARQRVLAGAERQARRRAPARGGARRRGTARRRPAPGTRPRTGRRTSTTRKRRARIASGSAISTEPSWRRARPVTAQPAEQLERARQPVRQLAELSAARASAPSTPRPRAASSSSSASSTARARAMRRREQPPRLARQLSAGVGRPAAARRSPAASGRTRRGPAAAVRRAAAADASPRARRRLGCSQHARRAQVGEQILGARARPLRAARSARSASSPRPRAVWASGDRAVARRRGTP